MFEKQEIIIIAAVAKNLAIGKEGKIPWRLKSDMARFKELTVGNVVVMGRKTFESLPKAQKPLPGRINIVISRSSTYEGVVNCHSFDEAMTIASGFGKTVFIIGGERIYNEAMSYAHQIYLTEVDTSVMDADAFFPNIDLGRWDEVSRESHQASSVNGDDFDFCFCKYERKPKEFTILNHARHADQRDVMARINERAECPFCYKNLFKEHKQPVIIENDNWIVTDNQWPYEGTERHILFIPKEHKTKIVDISVQEFVSLYMLLSEVEKMFNIESGALCMRFGNPRFNGGTVDHLHIHLIVPKKPTDEGFVDVKFRVSAKSGNKS